MKKLLVLALVLSMACVANAGLQLAVPASVDKDATVTAVVSSDVEISQGVYYLGFDATSTGDAGLDVASLIIDYPGSAAVAFLVNNDEYAGALGYMLGKDFLQMEFTDIVDPVDPVIGTLISGLGITGVSAGDMSISLYDGDLNFLGSYAVTVTPEPVTIGLLGLGALFLRRRK